MAENSKPVKPVKKAGTPGENDEKPLTTEELMRKHMEDPDHNISEEEFRDVQINTETKEDDKPDLEGGDERPHDVDKDHRFKTPWDVIE
jgi:hypothetical protein